MTNVHPAPGLGALVPGFFVVPQNPIDDANGGGMRGVGYIPHIGELLAAQFDVPQNPLRTNALAKSPFGCGCGGGCGGKGASCSCGQVSINGIGALSFPDLGNLNFSPSAIIGGTAGMSTYLVLAGAGLLAMSLLSRGTGYREAVSGARKRYPRRVSRLASAF